MKRLMITAAVVAAATAGGGAALVGASSSGGRPATAVENIAATQPQASSAPADNFTTTTGSTTSSSTSTSATSIAPAPAAPNSSTADEPGCNRASWQDRVQGAPAGLDGGDLAGDYLWHSSDGFHLRVTHHGDGRDVFTGVIRSSAPMAAKAVRLEGNDAFALSADRLTLTYRFYDYGHIDGVDFHTDCAARVVVGGLTVNSDRLGPDHVYLGAHKVHPEHTPFVIVRSRS